MDASCIAHIANQKRIRAHFRALNYLLELYHKLYEA